MDMFSTLAGTAGKGLRIICTVNLQPQNEHLNRPSLSHPSVIKGYPLPIGGNLNALIAGGLLLIFLLTEIFLHTLFLELVQTLKLLWVQPELCRELTGARIRVRKQRRIYWPQMIHGLHSYSAFLTSDYSKLF
jgi:hypothetical protein